MVPGLLVMATPPIVPPTDTLMPVGVGVAGVGGGDGDGGRGATDVARLGTEPFAEAGRQKIARLES